MAAQLSLLEVLAQIPDPRDPRGRRHPLTAILSLTVLAMLTGCQSYQAIVQFGRAKGFALAHALGFRRGKTPCKSTLSVLFRALDIDAFEAALARWVGLRLPPDAAQVIAIDGKTVRGSRDGAVPGQHLVAADAADARAVLAQIRVDAKTNEHKAALALLGIVPVTGRIVTGDARFCQRDVCAQIVADGGDYVFVVKDNQPSLAVDMGAAWLTRGKHGGSPPLFPPEDFALVPAEREASTTDKGHGRLEKRTLRTTTILTKHPEWAGLKQGFELKRERTQKGQTTVEVAYGITSLTPERADAHRLLELTRGHWGIENGLHYRRDVTRGEDQSRVRKGVAPQVMAALRNTVIHILGDVVAPSLAAAMRTMGHHLSQALSLLGCTQIE